MYLLHKPFGLMMGQLVSNHERSRTCGAKPIGPSDENETKSRKGLQTHFVASHPLGSSLFVLK